MGVTQYRRYALTGGIGSGKSTVARMFRDLGAVIIDADAISRELMEPGQEVLARTVNLFGESVLNADGTLNRARLAERIFAHHEEREKLNAIVHPEVRSRAAELVDDAVNSPQLFGTLSLMIFLYWLRLNVLQSSTVSLRYRRISPFV